MKPYHISSSVFVLSNRYIFEKIRNRVKVIFNIEGNDYKNFVLNTVKSKSLEIDQEYFDESNYDKSLGRVNTVPLLQKNLSKIKEINNVIPLIGDANLVSRFWQMKIGLLFIDGSHTKKSAEND